MFLFVNGIGYILNCYACRCIYMYMRVMSIKNYGKNGNHISSCNKRKLCGVVLKRVFLK